MSLVSFFREGYYAAKELINHDHNDKSFSKATPECFSRQEERELKVLIEKLNESFKNESVMERLSAQNKIDEMLNKSKEHLDFFLFNVQKDERLCSYLVEKSWFNMHGCIFKEQPEMIAELASFAINKVINGINGRVNVVGEKKNPSEEDKGSYISFKESLYSPFKRDENTVTDLLNVEISKLTSVDKIFNTDCANKTVENISLNLASYINSQASYRVEPEKFSGLVMKYYAYHAQSLSLPSATELDVLVNSVVKKIEDAKLLFASNLENLFDQPAGTRHAIHIAKLA
ncbi:hypothetical protein [Yersinia pekkanenii]|uniref:Uncharacterized protein n=1 Tax=Yersinia pekkanenii TaxID=1288385 RepID=A0A0T9PS97_9GAMM|nr:hypothetical protein [Yersinia pekkanenii]CNH79183.1 Uncharacterised protein [Yersinia pekkanenii]CRY67374.1 Uncharacterised protein [Yersinia pekkanenii]